MEKNQNMETSQKSQIKKTYKEKGLEVLKLKL